MQQITKQALISSFMKLLEERSFSRITVKDIARDCGVNRKTFYYYYEDIYALVEDIFNLRMQELKERTPPEMELADSTLLGLHFFRENRTAILHMLDGIGNAQFMRLLYKGCSMPVREAVYAGAEGLDAAEEDLALLVDFYTSAAIGMLFSWICDGMAEDPEAVVRRLTLLLKGTARLALKNAAESRKPKKPRKVFWTKQ